MHGSRMFHALGLWLTLTLSLLTTSAFSQRTGGSFGGSRWGAGSSTSYSRPSYTAPTYSRPVYTPRPAATMPYRAPTTVRTPTTTSATARRPFAAPVTVHNHYTATPWWHITVADDDEPDPRTPDYSGGDLDPDAEAIIGVILCLGVIALIVIGLRYGDRR